MNLLAILACTYMCILTADPVTNVPVSYYELHIVGEGRVADFFEPAVDFTEHPDLWRDTPTQYAWVAVGTNTLKSQNPSNPVWVNRSCLEHTGELRPDGVSFERLSCERECCAGCVHELPNRYPACTEETDVSG